MLLCCWERCRFFSVQGREGKKGQGVRNKISHVTLNFFIYF